MEKLTKYQATEAASQAWRHLYQIATLHDTAEFIRGNHEQEDHEQVQSQVNVLLAVAGDLVSEALEETCLVDNYFIEQSQPKLRKDVKATRNIAKPQSAVPVVFKQVVQAK